MVCMQTLQSLYQRKGGWFRCVSGWEFTKTTGSRASAHVVAFWFLIRNWHKQMSLSTQRLCRNFFKATAPGGLHHWACTCWAWPLWWFRWFPWPRPGPGSWMSRWISSTNPKTNGHKLRDAAEIPNSVLHIPSSFHHICTLICFHLFSAVYRNFTHCNTFSTKIHSEPHTPSGKRIRFPKGRWTSKLLRLRSVQVGPPIHRTKKDQNVLAAVSLKTQKSLLRSPALKNSANLDSMQHRPLRCMKNIQRKDGNRSAWPCHFLISFNEANS